MVSLGEAGEVESFNMTLDNWSATIITLEVITWREWELGMNTSSLWVKKVGEEARKTSRRGNTKVIFSSFGAPVDVWAGRR